MKTQQGTVFKMLSRLLKKDLLILLFFTEFWCPFSHIWNLSLFCFLINLCTFISVQMKMLCFLCSFLFLYREKFCLPEDHYMKLFVRSAGVSFVFACLLAGFCEDLEKFSLSQWEQLGGSASSYMIPSTASMLLALLLTLPIKPLCYSAFLLEEGVTEAWLIKWAENLHFL